MSPSFDAAAETYDRDFEDLPATARIREIVRNIAFKSFPWGGSLLELNCGTGTDAIAFSRYGFRVLATDASPSMIRVAKNKLAELPGNHDVEFRVMSFDQISLLRNESIAGVFSNMGGLNCLRDLRPLAESVAGIMKPGSHFIATFLSDFCLWETATFLLRFNVRGAFRRSSRNGTTVSIHGNPTDVYFHSPPMIQEAFSPFFTRTLLFGLNIFTPPPSSTRAYHRLGKGARLLESLDSFIAAVPPLNRMGDHFVVVLRRR